MLASKKTTSFRNLYTDIETNIGKGTVYVKNIIFAELAYTSHF